MELNQYAAEHIIENGKHYPEKWVNRYFIEMADAQRALDAEREKVKALEEQLRLANCDQANTEADLNDVTAQRALDALQAQLRHMTKERDIQKEVADNQAWHVRQLRQAIEHVHKAWAAKTPHEFHAWFAQNVALARAAQIEEGEEK